MAERTDAVWKTPSVAATYLEGVRAAIPLAQEQIEVMLRLLAASSPSPRRFLDLGCGDGVLSVAILNRFPEAQATLLDFSATMLEAAENRLQRHKTSVRFVSADYAAPAWLDSVATGASFDAIVSGYSIHHQPDARKRELYGEIFRLLAPGGIFVNIEHVSSPSPWVAAVNDDLFIEELRRHQPDKAREEIAETYYYRADKAANILAPVELQCQWLRELGFIDVDCYMKIFELAVFAGRRP